MILENLQTDKKNEMINYITPLLREDAKSWLMPSLLISSVLQNRIAVQLLISALQPRNFTVLFGMKLWQTKAGIELINYLCKTPSVHIRTSTKNIPSKTTVNNVRHTLPVCNAESA